MIEINNIYRAFRTHQVLDGLSLVIKTGETKVIIGRSGCGKSVLLKHIVGLLKPDKGNVCIDGLDITRLRDRELNLFRLRLKIGMLFQGGALFDSLTVGENVGFVLSEYTDLAKTTIVKKVKDALSMVGLKDTEHLMPADLSGGMKKRVALARAICMSPKILLYDEPTTGVDPITADAINDLIIELHDKLEVTSVVVTHDMNSAYKVADRIAMLYNGKIIQMGTSEEIKHTINPFVKQFITGAATGAITDAEHLVFGHVTE
jgi:phospholipid/cholesterol/gamma-HCH transport system ATP-binding protein